MDLPVHQKSKESDKEMKRAYYARPISIDDTPQAERDLALIRALGFAPYPIGADKLAALEEYKRLSALAEDKGRGMDAFYPYVAASDILVFRAFPDGSIGAGVRKEIDWALSLNIPVLELPRQIVRRTLSVEDTRAMLAELGQR